MNISTTKQHLLSVTPMATAILISSGIQAQSIEEIKVWGTEVNASSIHLEEGMR